MVNKGGFPKGFRIGLRRIGWMKMSTRLVERT
ncbi:AlpA family phage regulatory protein [Escherichia coli]|nr:AlpA family phage regulatory protein [Escherichia coli]MDM4916842.1 AlpA family phage regulatory protein [Escherichia coli]